MKKCFIGLFAAVLAVSMIGCKGEVEKTTPPKIDYEVGDIVLNDGTYLRGVTSVSDEDKEKAIAVIYKVDGSKHYGVGLVHSQTGLAWCLSTANGYNTYFNDTVCYLTWNGEDIGLTFDGDTDGCNNFTQIKKILGKKDDTGTAGNYPAFEFAKNYKTQANSHVYGTAYENDWYLPTVAELYDIWKIKATVDALSALCGGLQFGDKSYWSSTQYEGREDRVRNLKFSVGESWDNDKETNNYVCCIRIF